MKCFYVVLLAISISAYSQTPITSVNIPGKVSEIRGMLMGNDIFLSMVFRPVSAKPFIQSCFINPDGKVVSVNVDVIGDKPMIGGVKRDSSIFLYYVDNIHKKSVIRCVRLDRTGIGKLSDRYIEIPGRICGSYIEEGDLHILCAIKDKFTLRLLRIHDDTLQNEIIFPLSFDIGKLEEGRVSFFDTSRPTMPKDASAPVKIMREGNLMWISIDEPSLDFEKSFASNTFRTTVIRLDLLAGKSSIKSFLEPGLMHFVSAMSNGRLYRVYGGLKDLKMDTYNFETGKKEGTVALDRGNDPARDSTYARIGKYRKTEKDVKKAHVVKRVLGSLFFIEYLSSTQQLITMGHYGDQMIVLTSVQNIASIVLSAASLLIAEIAEGQYSCVYYYYAGSTVDGFTATYRTSTLRQVVDDYEYKLMRQNVMFDYKGYLYNHNMTYAFYQKRNLKEIEIVKFEK